jgi:hypothetical protein
MTTTDRTADPAVDELTHRCDDLGDLVPDDLRQSLIARAEVSGRLASFDQQTAQAEADLDASVQAGAYVQALRIAQEVQAAPLVRSRISVPAIDPQPALAAADQRIATAGAHSGLPALDYDTELAAYRALHPGLMRTAEPPLLSDNESELRVSMAAATKHDQEWKTNVANWRDVVNRQPDDVLNLLATAKGLIERAASLDTNRTAVAEQVSRANIQRRKGNRNWHRPAA